MAHEALSSPSEDGVEEERLVSEQELEGELFIPAGENHRVTEDLLENTIPLGDIILSGREVRIVEEQALGETQLDPRFT